MKNVPLGLIFALVMAGAGLAQAADSTKPAASTKNSSQVVIVVLSDLDTQRGSTVKLVGLAEAKALEKQIADEAKVFSKALALAKAEWETSNAAPAAGDGKTKTSSAPFPGEMLAPRKCEDRGTFADRTEAQKIMTKVQKETDAILAMQNANRNNIPRGLRGDAATKIKDEHIAASNNAVRAATAVQAKIDDLVKKTPVSFNDTTPDNAAQAAALLQAKIDDLIKTASPAMS